jgi:hypothetical protein
VAHVQERGNMLIRNAVRMMGNKHYKNSVQNGNLANGLSNWIHYSTFATESLVDGYIRSTRNTGRVYVGQNAKFSFPLGAKIYFRCKAKGNKSGTGKFQLSGTASSFATQAGGFAALNITQIETIFTGIITVVDQLSMGLTNASGFAIDGTDFSIAGDYIDFKDVIIVNLSEVFGVNIPSKNWCDAFIPQSIIW